MAGNNLRDGGNFFAFHLYANYSNCDMVAGTWQLATGVWLLNFPPAQRFEA